MRIWGEVPKVSQVYNKNNNVGKVTETSSVTSKKDKISISNNAKDYQTIMKALKDVPDVRQDKVNEIKEKYDSGDYDVSGEEVIDKLMNTLKEKKI